MAGMPERIGKGPLIRRLDKRYLEVGRHTERLARLTGAPSNKDVADIGSDADADSVILVKGLDKTHLKKHWFTKKDPAVPEVDRGHWKAEAVAKILKHGMTVALTEAKNRLLPLETLWICSGHPDDPVHGPFEVYVTWNPRQVTMIIHSPNLPPTGYTEPNPAVKEDMWVVKRIDTSMVNGTLDGPKDDDVALESLTAPFKIVKRRPKSKPDDPADS